MLSPTGHRSPTAAQSPPPSTASVPEALAGLPAGSLVTGTVTGRGANGHLLLRTDAGTLPLETRVDLERGAVVTLRVGVGPRFTATIELVDGRPAGPTAQAPAPPLVGKQPSPVGTQPSQAPPAASSLAVDNIRTAIVIAPYPDPAIPAQQALPPGEVFRLPTLASGDRIAFQIVSIDSPVAGTGPTSANLPTGAAGLPPTGAAQQTTLIAPIAPTALTAPTALIVPITPIVSIVSIVPQQVANPVPTEAAAMARTTAPPQVTSSAVPAPTSTSGLALPSPLPGSPATPLGAATSTPPNAPAAGPVTVTARPVEAPKEAPSKGGHPVSPTLSTTTPGRAAEGRVHAPPVARQPTPPAPSAAASTQGVAKPTFPATVVGIDGTGHSLLSTSLGTLRVEAQAPLPVGATLTLALVETDPRPLAPSAATGSVARGESLLSLAHDWPALREAIGALRHIDPKLADQVVQRTIAAPGTNLAQSTLFFLSALRGGDIAGWLGRGVARVLEDNGRGDLVRRLAGDFGQIARLADQPSSAEWQPILVPLHDGEQLRQLRLFVRRHRGDDDDSDGETRFVVDIELSRLGEMQLDGLLHDRRFDLIVRSHAAMTKDARGDIATIFSDGLAAAGLVGTLRFHVAKPFPVAPLDEIFAGNYDGVMV